MKHAQFDIYDKYPTKDDLEVWTEDEKGNKDSIDVAFAKTVPLIKLQSNRKNCDAGVNSSTSSFQDGGGGAVPTASLNNYA